MMMMLMFMVMMRTHIRQKGQDMFFMVDLVGEYAVHHLKKKLDRTILNSTTKAGLDIEDEDEKEKL